VPPRLVLADKKQTLAFTMGANDITFDITSAKVDELLSNAVAVGEMANDSQEERAQWYPDVRVLSVMFPASALAAHALQSIARGYGGGAGAIAERASPSPRRAPTSEVTCISTCGASQTPRWSSRAAPTIIAAKSRVPSTSGRIARSGFSPPRFLAMRPRCASGLACC
jgi:hypothetical protein